MSNTVVLACKPGGQYVLKFFEKSVKQELKASAALNDRSMNDEILYLIKRGQEAEQAKEAQHKKQGVQA